MADDWIYVIVCPVIKVTGKCSINFYFINQTGLWAFLFYVKEKAPPPSSDRASTLTETHVWLFNKTLCVSCWFFILFDSIQQPKGTIILLREITAQLICVATFPTRHYCFIYEDVKPNYYCTSTSFKLIEVNNIWL